MNYPQLYFPSLLVSILLTLAAVITLPSALGILSARMLTPWSTLVLLGVTCLNCILRAELIKGRKTT
jgi:hypothetical protein